MSETEEADRLVSILIATKNRRAYLRACLESSRAQTYPRLEILVSDDGSTDGTCEMVSEIALEDRRVRLLTGNPVPGAFGNFGYLLQNAVGEAVAFVGDDDLLEPVFVERLLGGLAQPGIGLAYGAFGVIDALGERLPDREQENDAHYAYSATHGGPQPDPVMSALRGQVWLGATLYRTTLIRSLGFAAEAGSAADLDVALRAAEQAGFWYAPERLWYYRDHSATISRDPGMGALTAYIGVLEGRAYVDPAREELRRRRLKRAYRQAVVASYAGDPGRARAYARRYRSVGGRTVVEAALVLLGDLPAPIRTAVLECIRRVRSRAGRAIR
ncbi:MAG TPA: glycosyltransferase family A protein [Candidatus Limnocylindrales bacterium]|nr:glycosyltransferase family A protein [Candidatus Limnocylindrales bacterium]